MGKGRPKKPDELHVLQGTWRKDRNGDPSTECVAGGEPEMTRKLKGEALKYWRRLVPDLMASGLAKARDSEALTALCEWWAAYGAAMDAGDTRTAAVAFDKWRTGAAAFGLTPMDRAKLRAPAKKQANDLDSMREAMG